MITALDPRFKHLYYLSDIEKQDVYNRIAITAVGITGIPPVKEEKESKDTVAHTAPVLPQLPERPKDNETDAKKPSDEKKPQTRILDGLLSEKADCFVTEVCPAPSPLETVNREILTYKAEPRPNTDEHPLNWWKEHQYRYPFLARLAMALMCTPATSVPSERVFSTAGDIVTQNRARLQPQHVDTLVFLKKNMK